MELQERQLRKRLREDFEPLIDMSDSQHHNEEEQAKIRTSRALAALTIAANAQISVEDACASVVDESGDEGLDAIGITLARGEIYVVQAKASSGSPSPTEVLKFNQGIRYLLDWDWDSLGGKTQKRRGEIETASEGDVKVIAIFSHFGAQQTDETATRLSDKLLSDVNSSGDILDFQYQGLRENHDNRNIASGLGLPDYDLVFERWITMNDYRSEIMGVVTGDQLAQMVDSFNERLFDKNIRAVLKATDTNKSLDATLEKSPQDFWYYNNGITIVSNSISCARTSPRTADETFKLQGLSVVNGAQTCGALGRALRENAPLEDVRVTVRVMSKEGHSEDFTKKVTRYTNTQNQVTNREFVSLDPYQQELSESLLSEQIQYSFRTGQTLDHDEYVFAFDLEEATRALACLTGVDNATRAKREIGRMWSDITASPYRELFPRNLNPATMYNAVRFWRAFEEIYVAAGKFMDSRSAGIVRNSTYMSCALFMQSARAEQVDFKDIDLDIDSWISSKRADIERLARNVVELHENDNPAGFPMSFFKNRQKIEAFSRKVRNRFWETGS